MAIRSVGRPKQSAEQNLALLALSGGLVFRPAPPGDEKEAKSPLVLPVKVVTVDAMRPELAAVMKGLQNGLLTKEELEHAIREGNLSRHMSQQLLAAWKPPAHGTWDESLSEAQGLDQLALLAVKVIDRAHTSLLTEEPLTELHFELTDMARAVLAVGWEAMVKRGVFPLPPEGSRRIDAIRESPCGAMHFVSASDLDAGYNYTFGIALSAEAQALGRLDASYGLDGELIVPGQAVSPIPPGLAIATRLFAAGIATSSNISEEEQSIPLRNFPQPTSMLDLEPTRGGYYQPAPNFPTVDHFVQDLRQQLWKNRKSPDGAIADYLPPVKAVFEVTELGNEQVRAWMAVALADKEIAAQRGALALYLNVESTARNRVERINEVADLAAELGLKYVAVADSTEDQWLPNLLEYLEPYELNAVADHCDQIGVVVIDGRPVDPVYTAATAAQRIQSVFTTLAVDILKMGMWLCLDALAARIVWREICQKNTHIPQRMLLMPIGIIEPWNAFVDNRDRTRTPRAILDPFEKIKFMIDEAREMGIPSLLTDTRHKETWVLLGRKTPEDDPHPREVFIKDGEALVCRTEKSAIPLLSWTQFMACERLARKANVLLGQAGSVETEQLFRIISETTYDAAKDGKNPATAIWTAETERVLSTGVRTGASLQSQRSAKVSPFLACLNRGFESHAKLDGWLRYLDGIGKKTGRLRNNLLAQRTALYQLLRDMMRAQADWQADGSPENKTKYQKAWDDFRTAYLAYHQVMVANFVSVKDLVAKAWASRGKRKPVSAKTVKKGKNHGK